MNSQRVNVNNISTRRHPPVQRVVPTPHRPMISHIHPNRVWPTLQAENRNNREVRELRTKLFNSERTISNVTDQLKDADIRIQELERELNKWRSGVYKLSCNCDLGNIGVFKDSDMSEGRSVEDVEVSFNIFDRAISPMDAQSNWDDQIDQFLGHEEGFASQKGSATNPPAYANFQEAANVAREEYQTPFIPDCKNLSVYLFDENGKRELPQLKKPLISAYNFYRKQYVNSRHVEWKHLSKEEMKVWTERFNLVRMVQVKQCRANFIAYEPSVNQKRKMKRMGYSSSH